MAGCMPLAIIMYEIVMPRLKGVRKCVLTDLTTLGTTFSGTIKYQAKMRTFIFAIHVSLVAGLVLVNVIIFSLDRTEFFIISLLFEENLPAAVSNSLSTTNNLYVELTKLYFSLHSTDDPSMYF